MCGRLALRLDQSESCRPTLAFTLSSSGASCQEASGPVLGALVLCGGAVVQREVHGHAAQSLKMVIEYFQVPKVVGPESRGVCGFDTTGRRSPLSGNLTGLQQIRMQNVVSLL